jgi:hypothetical protein
VKETLFRFELRVPIADQENVKRELEQKVLSLKGIDALRFFNNGDVVELQLSVSFLDGEEAKALHRRIMNALIACKRVTISQVTTKLSDIF